MMIEEEQADRSSRISICSMCICSGGGGSLLLDYSYLVVGKSTK